MALGGWSIEGIVRLFLAAESKPRWIWIEAYFPLHRPLEQTAWVTDDVGIAMGLPGCH
jgi:hypothetical protein